MEIPATGLLRTCLPSSRVNSPPSKGTPFCTPGSFLKGVLLCPASLRPSSRAHCPSRKALPPAWQTLTLPCRTRSFPVYSRAETWLPLCINKKHITKHFPQNASAGPPARREGWSFGSFPTGLKGSKINFLKTGLKDTVPAPSSSTAEVRQKCAASLKKEGRGGPAVVGGG